VPVLELDGETEEISDDIYDKVKAFAKFRAEQKRKEKSKNE